MFFWCFKFQFFLCYQYIQFYPFVWEIFIHIFNLQVLQIFQTGLVDVIASKKNLNKRKKD